MALKFIRRYVASLLFLSRNSSNVTQMQQQNAQGISVSLCCLNPVKGIPFMTVVALTVVIIQF